MQDGTGESERVTGLHDRTIDAMNRFGLEAFPAAEAAPILHTLCAIAALSSPARGNFQCWIWSYAVKFLNKQVDIDDQVRGAVRRLSGLLVAQLGEALRGTEDLSPTQASAAPKHAKLMVKVLLGLVSIVASKADEQTVRTLASGGRHIATLLEPALQARLLSSIYALEASAGATASASVVHAAPPLRAHSPAQPKGRLEKFTDGVCDGDLRFDLVSLIEQLPLHFHQLGREDQRQSFDLLLRTALACGTRQVQALLEGAMLRILPGHSQVSALFSKSLAEQIYLSTFFPFSVARGAHIHGRQLVPALMALWKLMLDQEDGALDMVLGAVGNMAKEGVFGTLDEVLILTRDTFKQARLHGPAVRLVCHLVPHLSYKQLVDALGWLGPATAAPPCVWKILAALGSSRISEAIHKNLTSTLVPLLMAAEGGTWPTRHLRMACMERYARYSEFMHVFEHPFLGAMQEELVHFLQKQTAPAADWAGVCREAGPLAAEFRKPEGDRIGAAVTQLHRLLLEGSAAQRSRHCERIEELVYLCRQ